MNNSIYQTVAEDLCVTTYRTQIKLGIAIDALKRMSQCTIQYDRNSIYKTCLDEINRINTVVEGTSDGAKVLAPYIPPKE